MPSKPAVSFLLCTVRPDAAYVEHPSWHVLDKVVEDLSCQTFQDFELIIVDGVASRHKSWTPKIEHQFDILHMSPSPRSVWVLARKSAISAYRNTGIAAARGELIINLDDCGELPWNLTEQFYHAWKRDGVLPGLCWPEQRDHREPGLVEVPTQGHYGFGSYPRELAFDLNGYDELYDGGQGLEDVDWTHRVLKQAQQRLLYLPGFYIHDQSKHSEEALDLGQPIVKCCNLAWRWSRVKNDDARANVVSIVSKRSQYDAFETLLGPCELLSSEGRCKHHAERYECGYLKAGFADRQHPYARILLKHHQFSFELKDRNNEANGRRFEGHRRGSGQGGGGSAHLASGLPESGSVDCSDAAPSDEDNVSARRQESVQAGDGSSQEDVGAELIGSSPPLFERSLAWAFIKAQLNNYEANVIVDVGANAGGFIEAIGRYLMPHDFAFLVEPSPHYVRVLKEQQAHLPCASQVIKRAVGAVTDIYEANFYQAYSLMTDEEAHAAGVIDRKSEREQHPEKFTVRQTSLDKLFLEGSISLRDNVTLLKIDVDGREAQVLEGGQDFIATFRPLIFLELSHMQKDFFGVDVKELAAQLVKDWKFAPFYVEPHPLGHNPIPLYKLIKFWPTNTSFDVLFVPEERVEDLYRFVQEQASYPLASCKAHPPPACDLEKPTPFDPSWFYRMADRWTCTPAEPWKPTLHPSDLIPTLFNFLGWGTDPVLNYIATISGCGVVAHGFLKQTKPLHREYLPSEIEDVLKDDSVFDYVQMTDTLDQISKKQGAELLTWIMHAKHAIVTSSSTWSPWEFEEFGFRTFLNGAMVVGVR